MRPARRERLSCRTSDAQPDQPLSPSSARAELHFLQNLLSLLYFSYLIWATRPNLYLTLPCLAKHGRSLRRRR